MASDDGPSDVIPGERSASYRSRTAVLFAVAEIVGKLASFGTFAVASRVLGPAGFGEYTWAWAVGAIVASFGMFGFDIALIQLSERNRGRVADYLSSAFAMRIAIGIIGVSAIALLPLSNPDARTLVIIMTLALSIDNLNTGMWAASSVIDRQRGPAMAMIGQRVVTAVASVSMLLLGYGVLAMGVAFLFGTTMGSVALLVMVTRFGIGPSPRALHRDSSLALVRKSILPGLANTMNMQTTRLGTVALGGRGDAAALGYFGGAFKLVETSFFVSESLIRSVVPEMLYAKDNRRVGEIVRTVLATDAVFYFPVALVLVLRGDDIMAVVYGSSFAAGGEVAASLAVGLLAWVTVGILTHALLVRHYSGDVAAVAGVALAVMLAVMWPLIDAYGAVGAGVALSAAYTVQGALLWWRLSRHGGRPRLGTSLLPATGAALVTAPVAYLPANFWLAMMLAGPVYVGTWVLLARRLDPKALAMVGSVVKR